jgi:hypothetical protein
MNFATILPVIGSLGVGAFVGAVVAHVLRERSERVKAEKEKYGLLRLLLVEMNRNKRVITDFEDEPASVVGETSLPVSTHAWDEVGVRLAQLLPGDEFDRLAAHYEYVHDFMVALEKFRRSYGTDQQDKELRTAKGQLKLLKNHRGKAFTLIETLLGWRDEPNRP